MTQKQALAYLKDYTRFIITTHDGPDADGIGAEYALFYGLKSLQKEAIIINSNPIPFKYNFIGREEDYLSIDSSFAIEFMKEPYYLIIVDTNDVHNLGFLNDDLLTKAESYLVIDHHEGFVQDKNAFIDVCSAASCELIYDLLHKLKAPLDLNQANALFAGMVYDTGSFIYPKTTAKTFTIAAELLKIGVKTYDIHGKMYESSSVDSLILQKLIQNTMELFSDDRIVVQTMPYSMVEEANAAYEDAEDFINIPLKAKSVEVSILFKENQAHIVRCSLRSKGKVNVSRIAQNFGGGGHKTASGFKCKKSIEETQQALLSMIDSALED